VCNAGKRKTEAPKFVEDNWDFGDRVREAELFGYYGYPPYY
jgi:hypothetical protein